MFDVMKYATRDDERIAQNKANAGAASERARALALGQALLKGETSETAKTAGNVAAQNALVNSQATWFEVDADGMYSASIEYLQEALPRLLALCALSDAQLATQAFTGDLEAKYILLSAGKQMILDLKAALDAMGDEEAGWELALLPRNMVEASFEEGEECAHAIKSRAFILEGVRRFWTEALHQTVNNTKMGVHIKKGEDWKL